MTRLRTEAPPSAGLQDGQATVVKDSEASIDTQTTPDPEKPQENLAYGIEDVPPWYQCLLLGFQNFLVFIGGTIVSPLSIVGYMCLTETDVGRGAIVSTTIFVSGIITLLQCTLGIRLPIIQGSNLAYLAPIISFLTTNFPPCDSLGLPNMTTGERQEVWQVRMREIQGAIAVSAMLQVILGITGVIGLMMVWVTPLAIIPTITMLGLSFFTIGTQQAATYWPIAALHLVLLVLVSQYLKKYKTPLLAYSSSRGLHVTRYPLFTYFPLLIVTIVTWGVCGVLTVTDVLPEGNAARTDLSGSLLANSPWVKIPYPGQWGMPTVSIEATVGMVASVIASIIESIGDYNACARLCQVPSPPTHAVNRGVGIEGIGCVLAGLFGTSSGTASYTGNIILIDMTKVGSRRVVVWGGVMMLVLGVFSKFCAVFATIPEPILGASLIYMFSLVTGVGLSSLRFISLSSSRNHFVLGFSLFMGLAIPNWLTRYPDSMNTGSAVFDKSITALLQTSMFVGGFLGLVLDNTIPGTEEERGLTHWAFYQEAKHPKAVNIRDPATQCYNLPFFMDALRRWRWTRWVPFLPTFEGFKRSKRVGDLPNSCQTETNHTETTSL